MLERAITRKATLADLHILATTMPKGKNLDGVVRLIDAIEEKWGVVYIEQLLQLSRDDLLGLPFIGEVWVNQLFECLGRLDEIEALEDLREIEFRHLQQTCLPPAPGVDDERY